jgi:transcriptional regulator with XRE-family HTH domain
METISERLKKLRKEKGITQLQLADLLHLTDKAISKWESGEGNPDISSLPKLAEIFNVSVDYLLTGKQPEENRILKDGMLLNMTDEERIITILKNDDWDSFVKFGYDKLDPLVRIPSQTIQNKNKLNALILDEIYKIEAKHIFSKLVELVINRKNSYRDRESRAIPLATLFNHHLDNFVKMCAITENLSALDEVGFNEFVIKNISDDKQIFRYSINESTLQLIFGSKLVSAKALDYISKLNVPNFFARKSHIVIVDPQLLIMNDLKISYLLQYKHEELLINRFEELMAILTKIKALFQEGKTSREIKGIKTDNGQFFFTLIDIYRTDRGNVITTQGVIQPLNNLLKSAIEVSNLGWIKKVNEYHKNIASMTKEQKYLDDHDLKLLEMKSKSNFSEEEILFHTQTRLKLTNLKLIFASLIHEYSPLQELHLAKVKARKIYDLFVEKSFIHYLEYVNFHLQKKNYKELFEFSTIYSLDSITDLILKQKYEEIGARAKDLFLYTEYDFTQHGYRIEANKFENHHVLNFLIKRSPEMKYNNKFVELVDRQFLVFGIKKFDSEFFLEECKKIKEEILNVFIQDIDSKIEFITGERKLKQEYDLVNESLTPDYFQSLLTIKDYDNFVIKMVVKLESKLKYFYKLEGDFKDMLDKYITKHLALSNIIDDEDNRYQSARETDQRKSEMTTLLYRLRMIRNSLVHSSAQQVMLSKEELLKILDFVESLKGEK